MSAHYAGEAAGGPGGRHIAIHALCIIKNEADVIRQTLQAASLWCDHIYVFDNGSLDRSWQIVQAVARELPAVVPFKKDAKPFTDSLRGEILQHFRWNAHRGDWWCILDADEFYIDDPRAFLAQVPDQYRAVWPQLYSYLFTDVDLEAYRMCPRRYASDIPITDKLRYYVLGEYTELRFFRHDPRIKTIPTDLGPVYPKRIRMRHFGYRSPEQITLRLETRREPMLRGEFAHEKRSNWVPGGRVRSGPAATADLPRDWSERIVPVSECHFDGGVRTLLPPLDWMPPADLVASSRRSFLQIGEKLRTALARLCE